MDAKTRRRAVWTPVRLHGGRVKPAALRNRADRVSMWRNALFGLLLLTCLPRALPGAPCAFHVFAASGTTGTFPEITSQLPAATGAGTSMELQVYSEQDTTSCTWTASSSVSWITIKYTTSDNGDGGGTGFAEIDIAPNPASTSRTGAVTVAGQKLSLTQAAVVPVISDGGVLNAASYMPALLAGGAIARGSLFSIFGNGLGPAQPAQASSYPLGASLGGVSITVKQGSTSVNVLPIYVSSTQVNAIMPSNAPLGAVSLTVTNSGTSSDPHTIQVANSNFGIFTVTSTGQGPGIIQNFISQVSQPLNTAAATAAAGQVVTLWGTGLGPISAPDNVAPPAGTLPVPVQVLVGGKSAAILYSGRAPCCAAEDQIVFEVPNDAPQGCFVPVVVKTGDSSYSNTATMAIQAQGQRCVNTTFLGNISAAGGKTATIIFSRWDFAVPSSSGSVSESSIAVLQDLKAGGDLAFSPVFSQPPVGSCISSSGVRLPPLADYLAGGSVSALLGTAAGRSLDAGAFLTVAGGNGTQKISRSDPNTAGPYSASLGGGLPGSTPKPLFLTPGTLTVNGSGGKDVGAFQATLTFSAPLAWTNRDQISSIDRTAGVTLTWTGGDPLSQIALIGGQSNDSSGSASSRFLCLAAVADGSFTVPPYVLANLPASASVSSSTLFLASMPNSTATTFTAPGIDKGYAYFEPASLKAVTVK
jgi:uncharacterized protein (TIGR03437 family)